MYNHRNYASTFERYGLNNIDDEKVERISSRLGYPIEDVARAISEVGTQQDEIEEYLRDRYNRG
jgi:hypothetical protein